MAGTRRSARSQKAASPEASAPPLAKTTRSGKSTGITKKAPATAPALRRSTRRKKPEPVVEEPVAEEAVDEREEVEPEEPAAKNLRSKTSAKSTKAKTRTGKSKTTLKETMGDTAADGSIAEAQPAERSARGRKGKEHTPTTALELMGDTIAVRSIIELSDDDAKAVGRVLKSRSDRAPPKRAASKPTVSRAARQTRSSRKKEISEPEAEPEPEPEQEAPQQEQPIKPRRGGRSKKAVESERISGPAEIAEEPTAPAREIGHPRAEKPAKQNRGGRAKKAEEPAAPGPELLQEEPAKRTRKTRGKRADGPEPVLDTVTVSQPLEATEPGPALPHQEPARKTRGTRSKKVANPEHILQVEEPAPLPDSVKSPRVARSKKEPQPRADRPPLRRSIRQTRGARTTEVVETLPEAANPPPAKTATRRGRKPVVKKSVKGPTLKSAEPAEAEDLEMLGVPGGNLPAENRSASIEFIVVAQSASATEQDTGAVGVVAGVLATAIEAEIPSDVAPSAAPLESPSPKNTEQTLRGQQVSGERQPGEESLKQAEERGVRSDIEGTQGLEPGPGAQHSATEQEREDDDAQLPERPIAVLLTEEHILEEDLLPQHEAPVATVHEAIESLNVENSLNYSDIFPNSFRPPDPVGGRELTVSGADGGSMIAGPQNAALDPTVGNDYVPPTPQDSFREIVGLFGTPTRRRSSLTRDPVIGTPIAESTPLGNILSSPSLFTGSPAVQDSFVNLPTATASSRSQSPMKSPVRKTSTPIKVLSPATGQTPKSLKATPSKSIMDDAQSFSELSPATSQVVAGDGKSPVKRSSPYPANFAIGLNEIRIQSSPAKRSHNEMTLDYEAAAASSSPVRKQRRMSWDNEKDVTSYGLHAMTMQPESPSKRGFPATKEALTFGLCVPSEQLKEPTSPVEDPTPPVANEELGSAPEEPSRPGIEAINVRRSPVRRSSPRRADPPKPTGADLPLGKHNSTPVRLSPRKHLPRTVREKALRYREAEDARRASSPIKRPRLSPLKQSKQSFVKEDSEPVTDKHSTERVQLSDMCREDGPSMLGTREAGVSLSPVKVSHQTVPHDEEPADSYLGSTRLLSQAMPTITSTRLRQTRSSPPASPQNQGSPPREMASSPVFNSLLGETGRFEPLQLIPLKRDADGLPRPRAPSVAEKQANVSPPKQSNPVALTRLDLDVTGTTTSSPVLSPTAIMDANHSSPVKHSPTPTESARSPRGDTVPNDSFSFSPVRLTPLKRHLDKAASSTPLEEAQLSPAMRPSEHPGNERQDNGDADVQPSLAKWYPSPAKQASNHSSPLSDEMVVLGMNGMDSPPVYLPAAISSSGGPTPIRSSPVMRSAALFAEDGSPRVSISVEDGQTQRHSSPIKKSSGVGDDSIPSSPPMYSIMLVDNCDDVVPNNDMPTLASHDPRQSLEIDDSFFAADFISQNKPTALAQVFTSTVKEPDSSRLEAVTPNIRPFNAALKAAPSHSPLGTASGKSVGFEDSSIADSFSPVRREHLSVERPPNPTPERALAGSFDMLQPDSSPLTPRSTPEPASEDNWNELLSSSPFDENVTPTRPSRLPNLPPSKSPKRRLSYVEVPQAQAQEVGEGPSTPPAQRLKENIEAAPDTITRMKYGRRASNELFYMSSEPIMEKLKTMVRGYLVRKRVRTMEPIGYVDDAEDGDKAEENVPSSGLGSSYLDSSLRKHEEAKATPKDLSSRRPSRTVSKLPVPEILTLPNLPPARGLSASPTPSPPCSPAKRKRDASDSTDSARKSPRLQKTVSLAPLTTPRPAGASEHWDTMLAREKRNLLNKNTLLNCKPAAHERQVKWKPTTRPPSPTAASMTLLANESRKERKKHFLQTGVELGAGDKVGFKPKMLASTEKGVRWGAPLESGLEDSIELHSPSTAKVAPVKSPKLVNNQGLQLDRFGNVEGLSPLKADASPKVIRKILYKGEKEDE